MFDEFDIVRKEVSNDFFKLECVIETEAMRDQILSMEDVMTESEDGTSISEKISALKEKVVEIFKKIADKFTEAMNKLFGKERSEQLKAKAEKLKEEATVLIEQCKKDPELAKKVNDELEDLEGVRIEDLDPKKVQKFTASTADKFVAWLNNASKKITNGEIVTPEEIAEAKAMGDMKPFTLPNAVKIGLRVLGILSRISAIVGTIGIIASIVSINPTSIILSSVTVMVNNAASSGCKKLADMPAEDKANIKKNRKIAASESEVISNATQVANAAAYVESKLKSVEADAYAAQIKVLTEEISKINSIISKYKKSGESAEA